MRFMMLMIPGGYATAQPGAMPDAKIVALMMKNNWVEVLEAAGVPCGPVYNYPQMFADAQIRHRGVVQYASNAELGEVPHIGTPVRIGETVRVRTAAPKLGKHNAEIFGRPG
jgi:crotonobetainyl-CoA:carnitine CoA-transferase CaiB-like acyl-CoA transferase